MRSALVGICLVLMVSGCGGSEMSLTEYVDGLNAIDARVRPQVEALGAEYWQGLVDWMRKTMLVNGCVEEGELHLFTIVDDSESAAKIILQHSRMLQAQEISE